MNTETVLTHPATLEAMTTACFLMEALFSRDAYRKIYDICGEDLSGFPGLLAEIAQAARFLEIGYLDSDNGEVPETVDRYAELIHDHVSTYRSWPTREHLGAMVLKALPPRPGCPGYFGDVAKPTTQQEE